jgi:hypothetical protein
MVAIEVVAAVLVFALLVLSTAMAIVGLMAVTRVIRLTRCPSCRHLVPTSSVATSGCLYCDHERIWHPRVLHVVEYHRALGSTSRAHRTARGGHLTG